MMKETLEYMHGRTAAGSAAEVQHMITTHDYNERLFTHCVGSPPDLRRAAGPDCNRTGGLIATGHPSHWQPAVRTSPPLAAVASPQYFTYTHTVTAAAARRNNKRSFASSHCGHV